MSTLTPATIARQLFALSLLCAAAIVLGLALGSSSMHPWLAAKALLGLAADPMVFIVRNVRLPTVILACMVGAFLGGSGAAMQGLLRNPLADPYLLGVSGGAALGAAVVVMFDWPNAVMPVTAFLGAMAAVGLIHSVAAAMPGGLDAPNASTTLLLTGVVFNALCGAAILIIHAIAAPQQSQEIILWMMGHLSPARAASGGFVVAAVAGGLGLAALIFFAHRLDVLSLGDAQAAALGVHPGRTRTRVFILAAVVVGCAVAYSGLIGFVGLVVPHLVRLRWGPDMRRLIPASAIGGATFLVLADAGARAAFPLVDSALPVGAITALVGAPLFVLLLRNNLQRGGFA